MVNNFVLKNVSLTNNNKMDISIKDGKIVGLFKAGTIDSSNFIDGSTMFVSSGWIDLHVHAFSKLEPYGDEMDEIGIQQGVTTLVDAGSCGSDTISELMKKSREYKTNLLAFLNISRIGLQRTDELSNLEWINNEILPVIDTYKNMIVGLKARISKSVVGTNGIKPLHLARNLSKNTTLPLMVHIGSGPPSIKEILPLLQNRDIITHYLNGKPNNLFEDGYPLKVFIDALKRGIHLDVGHGTASFSFHIAKLAYQQDIHPHTISSDIYRYNRLNGPVYSLANVMTKFLHIGYSLEEVINAVTSNAASWLKRPELGRIQVGDVANLTLFSVENRSTTLVDSEGVEQVAEKRIVPKGVVINGEYFEC